MTDIPGTPPSEPASLSPSFGHGMMHDFSIGRVFSDATSIMFKNLVPFVLLCAIMYLPLIAYTVLAFNDLTDESLKHWEIALTLGERVLSAAASAVLMYGTVMQMRGQHAPFGSTVAMGLKRAPAAILVGIVAGIATAFGVLALIIGAVIVACGLWVAVPASVIERPGIFGALGRSWALTKGYKAEIFGILFIVGIVNFGIGKIVEIVVANQAETLADVKMFMLIAIGISIVVTTYYAVLAAVGYMHLRRAKESIDVDQIAAVFD